MKSIFVNRLGEWLRIAITREGVLEYYAVDGPGMRDSIGAIHLGRVTNVVPAIQAAFLDIGQQQNAFLNRGDLPEAMIKNQKTPIESLIKEGQSILVQIRKPPYQDKLARVSADLKLLGFFTVLTPLSPGVRFSKRFQGDAESLGDILRQAVSSVIKQPDSDSGSGVILRSNAAGLAPDRIVSELTYLGGIYRELRSAAGQGPPRRLHEDGLIMRCLYNHWQDGIRSLYFDHRILYERYKQLVKDRNPDLLPAVKFHMGDTSLYDTYKLESEIQKITAPKVWLKSGGALHIHQTEAMVTIDVDTGKQRKQRGKLSVALQTNLEAVEEAARQIRVRNLSGLIVLDLINAPEADWRKVVDQTMRRSLKQDSAKTHLVPVNTLGILALSRERGHLDLNRSHLRSCRVCKGTGWVKKRATLAREIQQALVREAAGMAGETLIVACGNSLAEYLEEHHRGLFEEIEHAFDVSIRVTQDPKIPRRSYQIRL